MSSEETAGSFRDVIQAQKEEACLLQDVSSIIEAMKSLSCNRGKTIEGLEQAHATDIAELKVAHAHQIRLMKAQHSRALRAVTQTETAQADMLQANNDEIERLECVVSYQGEKIEKLRECLLRLLERLGDARKQNSCVAGSSEQLTSEKALTEHLKTQLEEKTIKR